jgi:hypothetical protein
MNPNPPQDNSGEGASPLHDPGSHAPPADLDFQIVRLIGQGAYGDVWLVRDQSGNYFACKVVYRESFREDRPYEREYEGIQKFEPVSRISESQVKILHVDRRDDSGYFYYIMELGDDVRSGTAIAPESYVPKTLRSEIQQRGRLPARECIQIGLSLSSALENLHRHGLIHRDIKPANIIFVNGVPKLADIGLVTDLDVTISYVGTEGFIPPEGPKSAQADVYALGKVLYEIATGKDRLDFPELPENFSGFPDWELLLELNAVIIKACETDPGNRYASAKKFHDDLALLSAGKSVRKTRATRRRIGLLLRVAGGVAALAVIAAGVFYLHAAWIRQAQKNAPPGGKIPWPAAHELAESEAKLKDDYRMQLDSGSPPVRQQAAAELLKRSGSNGDPAFEAASLRVAGLLAADAGDVSLAMEICGQMEDRFEISVFPEKADLLEQAGKHARTPRNRSDLAETCLATGFAAVAADVYGSATRLANLARNFSAQSADSFLIPQAAFLSEETIECGHAFEGISNDWRTFRAKPNDPRAALAVGKFFCFEKNDWMEGLPLLLRGNDQALKAVANTEINGKLTGTQEQRALGDSWWDLSTSAAEDDQDFYQHRARYWYLKAIGGSADPGALRQELSERLNAVSTEAGAVHIVSRVGGTEFVDLYSDEAQWTSSRRGTTGNKLNHVNLGDFKAGGMEVIKNNGATWFMPDAVDFSTARLVVDRKSNGQGQATLRIFDDHVRITLAHPRLGASEIEVTVYFGPQP